MGERNFPGIIDKISQEENNMKTEKNGTENGSRQEKEELMALISSLSLEDKQWLLLKLRAITAPTV